MDAPVKTHYHAPDLIAPVKAALEAKGQLPRAPEDPPLSPKALAPVDQLHTGGLRATQALCRHLGPAPDTRILDAGCGIGGTARIFAQETGCSVVGIDLSPSFIEAAQTFTQWCGLGHRIDFHIGSITQVPFDDNHFDLILCQHILMNIEEKDQALDEFFRVLAPGGRLVLSELYQGNDKPIAYPVPWADGPGISFLESWAQQENRLKQTGFVQASFEDATQKGVAFWEHIRKMAPRAAALPTGTLPAPKTPALGPHLVFGKTARHFKTTMAGNFTSGALQWVDTVYQKPKT